MVNQEKGYLSIKSAAVYLDIPVSTLEKNWRKIFSGKVNAIKLPNGRYRFPKNEVDRLMKNLQVTKEG